MNTSNPENLAANPCPTALLASINVERLDEYFMARELLKKTSNLCCTLANIFHSLCIKIPEGAVPTARLICSFHERTEVPALWGMLLLSGEQE